ncbi:hypothetical protein BJQ89_03468 [Arthrobacter sp. ES1]|nr:hypothetical protein [Arthrobacter sp. ES1]
MRDPAAGHLGDGHTLAGIGRRLAGAARAAQVQGEQFAAHLVPGQDHALLHPGICGLLLVAGFEGLSFAHGIGGRAPAQRGLELVHGVARGGDSEGLRVALAGAVYGEQFVPQRPTGQGAVGVGVFGGRVRAAGRGGRVRVCGPAAGAEPGVDVGVPRGVPEPVAGGSAEVVRGQLIGAEGPDFGHAGGAPAGPVEGAGIMDVHVQEAAEDALDGVEVAAVVFVACHGAGVGYVVNEENTVHHGHVLGEPGQPGFVPGFVAAVVHGGGRIFDDGLRTGVAGDGHEAAGWAVRHQPDVAQGSGAVSGEDGGPDNAEGAVAQEVQDLGAAEVIRSGQAEDLAAGDKAVAGGVPPPQQVVRAHVDQVRGAGGVQVRKPDPTDVQCGAVREAGRVEHTDGVA